MAIKALRAIERMRIPDSSQESQSHPSSSSLQTQDKDLSF